MAVEVGRREKQLLEKSPSYLMSRMLIALGKKQICIGLGEISLWDTLLWGILLHF